MKIPRVRPRPERLKRCAGPCRKWLSVLCFGLDRTRADGRRSVCRECRLDLETELRAGRPRRRPWQTRQTVRAAALRAGVSVSTVQDRINRGETLEEAVRGGRRPWRRRCAGT